MGRGVKEKTFIETPQGEPGMVGGFLFICRS
jgi:hypothetical protein